MCTFKKFIFNSKWLTKKMWYIEANISIFNKNLQHVSFRNSELKCQFSDSNNNIQN
jgi:hypothetical protein